MRLIGLLLCTFALTGCQTFWETVPNLNSEVKAQSTLNMTKKCGCAGNVACCKMGPNCAVCCSAEDCRCNQVTQIDNKKDCCK